VVLFGPVMADKYPAQPQLFSCAQHFYKPEADINPLMTTHRFSAHLARHPTSYQVHLTDQQAHGLALGLSALGPQQC
jgi:hypothetical protein